MCGGGGVHIGTVGPLINVHIGTVGPLINRHIGQAILSFIKKLQSSWRYANCISTIGRSLFEQGRVSFTESLLYCVVTPCARSAHKG